ncbi:hypothetical protein [Planococcus plakortidis]|uniref:hypothetical protein n=1 Tax=Planococcus plakortidis TaxID=1038856 RepID=UPI00385D79C0
MKAAIIAAGLFISGAIMLSAAYIASAILKSGSYGQSILTPQTQVLYLLGLAAAFAAIVLLAIDHFRKD